MCTVHVCRVHTTQTVINWSLVYFFLETIGILDFQNVSIAVAMYISTFQTHFFLHDVCYYVLDIMLSFYGRKTPVLHAEFLWKKNTCFKVH